MNTNNTAQLLPQAFSLHQAGNIDEAESIYRKILEEDADNLQVLGMLGMLCMQRGNWDEGIRLLNVTLAIDPDQPDTLSNLGYALQALQRYDEALVCYDKAIALFPDHVSAYYNRGHTLQRMEKYQDAADSFRKALALRPNHADTYVNLGNVLAQLGLHDEALTNYIKALNFRPGDPGISNNLGLALKRLGRYREALTYFDKALALRPDYADAHFNRAIALQELGRDEEALVAYNQAIARQPSHADAYCGRGRVLQSMGDIEEARASYQAALAINPESVSALTRLGMLYIDAGKGGEATGNLAHALEIDPECAEACHGLAMMGHFAKDKQSFAGLESLYASRDALTETQHIYLDFAMGKTIEDMGRYDEAFTAYEAGNRLYHRSHPCDETAEEQFVDDSIAFFTAELFARCRSIADTLCPTDDDRIPVFIVGLPQAGGLLIEQLLSAHPEVFGAGQPRTFDRVTAGTQLPQHEAPGWEAAMENLGKRGRDYMEQVWRLAPDSRYITDASSGNFRHLGLLHLMLPRAKIIHVMRDPLDSCFSSYASLPVDEDGYARDLDSLGRYYQRYMKLMQHWYSVLPEGGILNVKYEDIIFNSESEVRRMLDYLGLPWDEEASLNFNDIKGYAGSIGRWKHFAKYLGPLRQIISV